MANMKNQMRLNVPRLGWSGAVAFVVALGATGCNGGRTIGNGDSTVGGAEAKGLGGKAGSGGVASGTSGSSARGSADNGGTATGGAALAGVAGRTTTGGAAIFGAAGIGCTGSLEAIQAITGLCVAKMVTITVTINTPSEVGGSAGSSAVGGSAGIAGVVATQTFGIDATEVTRGQYAAWLATTTAATISKQDQSDCGWNTTFKPVGDWDGPSPSGAPLEPGARSDYPVTYMDWCDSYEYCKAVGKRLCGKIGGGPNGYADYANASLSQWYAACSSGGVNVFPYAGPYQSTSCNGSDYRATMNPDTSTTPVGSLSGCQAPPPHNGIYDLSGNVEEWEDSCESTMDGAAGASASNCRLRGGNNFASSAILACGYSGRTARRSDSFNGFGFRCCSL